MDHSQAGYYARTALVALLLLVITTFPASASGSITVVTRMPVPVPMLPAVVPAITAADLPVIDLSGLQGIDTSEWDSAVGSISAARTTVNSVMLDVADRVSTEIARTSTRMGQARSVINNVRARVGSPMTDVHVVDGSTTYTAYSIAYDSVNAIQVSIAYLRGLSRLGGVGLDLTFVLLGLGWLVFVNLTDLLLRSAIALVKFITNVIGALLGLINTILNLISAIVDIIDVVVPFT